MKTNLTPIFFLIIIGFSHSNKIMSQIKNSSDVVIGTKDLDLTSLFTKIQSDISDSRVVFLGEINHGDGNVFELKTELVKFLHEEMGFDILAFESGIYELNKAQRNIDSGMEVYDALDQSIFPIWTYSKEFQPLISYLQENQPNIEIAGFDNQLSGDYTDDYFTLELDSFITVHSNNLYLDFKMYSSAVTYMKENNSFPEEIDFPTYKNLVKAIKNELNRIIDSQNDNKIKEKGEFLLQCNKSIYSLADYYYHDNPKSLNAESFEAEDSNPRDLQMADNLLFLLEANQDKKIICWGASMHFANKVNLINNEELSHFIPMGSYIKEKKDIKSYSIAFTTSGGTYAPWFNNIPDTVPIPDQNSLEYELLNQEYNYGWINLKEYPKDVFVSNVLDFTPLEGQWSEVFDAFFYVKYISPSHIEQSQEPVFIDSIENQNYDFNYLDSSNMMGLEKSIKIRYLSSKKPFQIVKGQIFDTDNKEGIPYASIQVGNEPYGTSANQYGIYQIKVPFEMRLDTLWFSCMGYQKEGIKLEGTKNEIVNCQLDKATYELEVLDISSEKVTANSIMLNVIKSIPKNYNSDEHSMSFYIKDFLSINDTSYRDNEFVGEVFYNKRVRKNMYLPVFKEAKYTHQQKEQPIIHPLFTEFTPWLYLEYKVKLNSVFIKKEQKNYVFELDTILDYKETYAYKITFKKESKTSSGKHYYFGSIYINSIDYSVIRFELNRSFNADKLVNLEEKFADLKNYFITDFEEFEHNLFVEKEIYNYEKWIDGFYYPKDIYFTRSIKETDTKLNKSYYSTIIEQFYFYDYRTDKKYDKDEWDVSKIIFPKPNENPRFWRDFVPPIGYNIDKL